MTSRPGGPVSPQLKAGTFVQYNVNSSHAKSRPIGWIVSENGCEIWTGAHDAKGYGFVGVGNRTVRRIHRVRYEQEVGPIPEGLVLDHFVCNNPTCCNPAHCRPVMTRENVLRGNGLASAQLARTHCVRGHELSGENLRRDDLKHGHRRCRTCCNARRREPAYRAHANAYQAATHAAKRVTKQENR